jgi:hypothetical protein
MKLTYKSRQNNQFCHTATVKDHSSLPLSNSFSSHPNTPRPYHPNAPQPVHNPVTETAAALGIEAQQPHPLATNLNTFAVAALFNQAFGDGSGGTVLPNITVDSCTGQNSIRLGGGGQWIITDSFGHAAANQNGIGCRNTKTTNLFAESFGIVHLLEHRGGPGRGRGRQGRGPRGTSKGRGSLLGQN